MYDLLVYFRDFDRIKIVVLVQYFETVRLGLNNEAKSLLVFIQNKLGWQISHFDSIPLVILFIQRQSGIWIDLEFQTQIVDFQCEIVMGAVVDHGNHSMCFVTSCIIDHTSNKSRFTSSVSLNYSDTLSNFETFPDEMLLNLEFNGLRLIGHKFDDSFMDI